MHPRHNEGGDLPNLFVGKDGLGYAQFFAPQVSFDGKNGRPALADADGSALVIHANADDFQSQPIGGSGDRIACGVLTTHMAGHAGH
jgi:Cu-Zn family superoxide dismutase